jgi:tetratricopeptide (TPR) repeat protein
VTGDGLSELEDELADCDRAIAADPGNAKAHSNRGKALTEFGPHHNRGILLAEMGELDDALAELDRAEGLDPDWAGEGSAWAGAILWHQRDSAGARDRFARVQNRVGGCTPFRTAEMEAVALCGLGQPDEAEQRLLGSLPSRTTGDLAEPRGLYDLLSDPPLPGIDRLRAIADSGT